MIILTIVNSGHKVQKSYYQEELLIGNGASVDILLDHPKMSGEYLKIAKIGEDYCLINLLKDPSILLNGLPFSKRRLFPGDVIQIHELTLIVDEIPFSHSLPRTQLKSLDQIVSVLDEKMEQVKLDQEEQEWAEILSVEEREIYEEIHQSSEWELLEERPHPVYPVTHPIDATKGKTEPYVPHHWFCTLPKKRMLRKFYWICGLIVAILTLFVILWIKIPTIFGV